MSNKESKRNLQEPKEEQVKSKIETAMAARATVRRLRKGKAATLRTWGTRRMVQG